MKRAALIIVLASLAACATSEEQVTQDTEQAVRDFIAVREIPEVDEVHTSNSDHYEDIDQNFVIYSTRDADFLFEFTRRCYELERYPIVPDVRHGNYIRARFDTLRGCHVAKIFPLNKGEVAELRDIGESPGSRN